MDPTTMTFVVGHVVLRPAGRCSEAPLSMPRRSRLHRLPGPVDTAKAALRVEFGQPVQDPDAPAVDIQHADAPGEAFGQLGNERKNVRFKRGEYGLPAVSRDEGMGPWILVAGDASLEEGLDDLVLPSLVFAAARPEAGA